MNVSFDTKALEADLGRVGKQLTKAMALTLTDSSKYANADLIKSLATKVDRPSPFTLRPSGYGVTVAKVGTANMCSEAYIKPAQSAYLKFILEAGGVRGLGYAGAPCKNVFVPGQRPDATLRSGYSVKPRRSQFGGVPNAYSQKLFDQTNAAPKGGGGVFGARSRARPDSGPGRSAPRRSTTSASRARKSVGTWTCCFASAA